MRTKMFAPSLLALAASAVQVQAQQCGGADAVGSLGISQIECDCVIAPATTRTEWQFRSQPRIRRIEAGSAASGVLQVDDVILSVNGNRITTEAGARALASLRPNEPVTLTVLRAGVVRTEVLRPTSVCRNDPTLLGAAPALQRVRVAGAADARPSAAVSAAGQGGARAGGIPGQRAGVGGSVGGTAAPGARGTATVRPRGGNVAIAAPNVAPAYAQSPRAWLGIAFSCSDCSFRADRAGGVWTFATPPEVYSVEPGSPAYAAGVRRGDVLTHINDVSITTEAGGLRWAQLKPGDQVRLRYRRGTAVRTANFEAVAPRGAVALRSSAQLRELESALTRDTVTYQRMQQNAQLVQEYYAQLQGQNRLSQNQLQAQLAELAAHTRTLSPEERRRYDELLQAIAQSQQRNNESQEQLAALIRANRTHTARLMATQDSIERALVTLRSLQATTAAGEQRLRYSGTFSGTDIEVRGVSPVVVSETPDEITIRIGDAVVTLKRSRH